MKRNYAEVHLTNGAVFTSRITMEELEQLQTQQKRLILTMQDDTAPANAEEYHEHYKSFDAMLFAFTDIEMVFDEERRAVDWIFRYANPALAKPEKLPLESLIDHSFGSLFANMDAKWLRSYERAVLYGELLEIFDYSPEIDTYLRACKFRGLCINHSLPSLCI